MNTANYTPCTASDGEDFCREKAFSPIFSSFGKNADISSIDTTLIAIWHAYNGLSDGHGITVYESDDCTGVSNTWEFTDVEYFEQVYGEKGNDISLLPTDFQPKFTVDAAKIGSIRIPDAFLVDFFSADIVTSTGSEAPFLTLFGTYTNACQKVHQRGNLQSIHIGVGGDPAIGQWVNLASSSQGVNYKYTEGIKSTNTKTDSKQSAKSLEVSVEDSFSFLGTDAAVKVDGKVSEQATTTIQNMTEKDVTKELDFSCQPDPQYGDKYGANLYQWQITNGEDTALS